MDVFACIDKPCHSINVLLRPSFSLKFCISRCSATFLASCIIILVETLLPEFLSFIIRRLYVNLKLWPTWGWTMKIMLTFLCSLQFMYYAGWLNAKAGLLADRWGRRDKMLKSRTVLPKLGRMVTLTKKRSLQNFMRVHIILVLQVHIMHIL